MSLDEAAHGHGDYTHGGSPGLTKREYAAIHLCVPDSGNPELDAMIEKARRDRFAAAAPDQTRECWSKQQRAVLVGRSLEDCDGTAECMAWYAEADALLRYIHADAMLKESRND